MQKKKHLFCHFFIKQGFLLSKNQIFGINIHKFLFTINQGENLFTRHKG
jgi:hypothetical protein